MMRLTYAIITDTMFSNDVKIDYGALARHFVTYLDTLGRVDVLSTLGVPYWAPTPKRIRARATLKFFRTQIGALIARRADEMAKDPAGAPKDLLTLLLTARDPEGGTLFGDEEVYDNAMTFIFAGHETTANALAWTLYLLSQFPDADARVAEEVRGGERRSGQARLYAHGPGGGAQALPAGAVRQPGFDRAGHGGAARDPRRHLGADLALDPAPPSHLVGGAGLFRSRALRAGPARGDPPLRLYPVRRGAAHLHRHGLRDAGGADRAGRGAQALAAVAGTRPSGDAAGTSDAAPGVRVEDAGGARR